MPNIIEVLAAAGDGLFLLFTNGAHLDSRAAEEIREASNVLPVLSVEGEEKDPDARRGIGAAVREAMAFLRETKVAFTYSTMLTHENLDVITGRDYPTTMWDAGARLGFLVDYNPVPGSSDRRLVLTAEDRRRKRERLGREFPGS